MKALFIISLLLEIGGWSTPKTDIPKDAVKGDFNGDGRTEYVWVIKPKLAADGMSCVGPCNAKLVFSDPHIKPINLKNSIGGIITNLGDLNGDGKDDIGLLPEWFTSCWRSYLTYTFSRGEWKYLVAPFSTHCNQWEDNVQPLEKVSGKPGYLKENYSDFNNDEIVVKSKIVKTNR